MITPVKKILFFIILVRFSHLAQIFWKLIDVYDNILHVPVAECLIIATSQIFLNKKNYFIYKNSDFASRGILLGKTLLLQMKGKKIILQKGNVSFRNIFTFEFPTILKQYSEIAKLIH